MRTGLFTAAATCLLLLAASGCSQKEDVATLELAFKQPEVTSRAGQVFISVKSNSSWKVDVTEGDWGTVLDKEGTGNKNSVRLSFTANPVEEARTLTITATAGSASVSRILVQRPMGAEEDIISSDDDKKIHTTSVPTWLEIPEVRNSDGCDFISHKAKLNGRLVRNYSLYWKYSDMVALWVAYPLCREYTNKVSGRTDAWGLDPMLPAEDQPVLYKGYSSGNGRSYDRGHQIPSADRLGSNDLNVQTFYSTNMTPQLGVLNQKVWATLENKVRSWAESSDTLYVVTGCTVDGSKDFCYDNVGKKVTVPTGYFKACLRYSAGSTVGISGYMGYAVWFDHKEYSSITRDMTMSIKDMEEKLGYRLFPGLDSRIGTDNAAKVKAEDPDNVNFWW